MTETEVVELLRSTLANAGVIRETRMFGGTGFMLNGNMIAGTFRQGLLVRVGRDNQQAALATPGSRLMEMNGRVMEGYVYFDPQAMSEDGARAMLRLALPFVLAMPPKPEKTKPVRKGKPQ